MNDAPYQKGTQVGPYTLVRELGHGGMSTVWLGERMVELAEGALFLDRVAIKIPHDMRRFWSTELSERRLAMHWDEWEVGRLMTHDNLVHIESCLETDQNAPLFVMELVDGFLLSEVIRLLNAQEKYHIPIVVACDMLRQVALGLYWFHTRTHLVEHRRCELEAWHGDIKPDNILLSAPGHVKLFDYSVSRFLGQRFHPDPGDIVGTVEYMAPEQARCTSCDHRTDIFAIGSILYELLTGKRAFHIGTAYDTLHYIVAGDLEERISEVARVDQEVGEVLQRCWSRDKRRRYQSAIELARDFQCVSSQHAGDAQPSEHLQTWIASVFSHLST